MKTRLDVDSWLRRDHFHFFRQFDEPYHGVNILIDCTHAYQFAKNNGLSFWLYYLYQSLRAAQQIAPFKYRIEGDEVVSYERIDAGSTIGRNIGTFGFGDLIYKPSFEEFITGAEKVIGHVQGRNDLELSPAENVIRYSALPWIDFTALSHARMFAFKDSCPKITFGKMTEHNGKRTMPVSIHVHHALVDGRDLAQYINCYQDLMNK